MQLLVASLLTVPSPRGGALTDKASPSMSYPNGYGLDFSVGIQREFEVDGLSPEVVTANQRACEVRIQDWS